MSKFDLNRLVGDVRDFEQEVYSFVLERLFEGIKIQLPENLSLSPSLSKICKFEEFLSNTFLSTHLDSNRLRGRIIAPFYYSVFYPNDEVEVTQLGKGLFSIKLLNKSPERTRSEKNSCIFDKESYLVILKEFFIMDVGSIEEKLTKREATYLEKNQIIPSGSFQLRPNKTSKGVLNNVDLAACKSKFKSMYYGNNLWPHQFKSIQGYTSFYRAFSELSQSDALEVEMRVQSRMKMNIDFWSQDIINYDAYKGMIDKYGP